MANNIKNDDNNKMIIRKIRIQMIIIEICRIPRLGSPSLHHRFNNLIAYNWTDYD